MSDDIKLPKNRIAELRKKKNLSQTQLAKNTGLTRQAISLYEIGKREPKLDTWIKLADFFNVPVSYLQGLNDTIAPNKIDGYYYSTDSYLKKFDKLIDSDDELNEFSFDFDTRKSVGEFISKSSSNVKLILSPNLDKSDIKASTQLFKSMSYFLDKVNVEVSKPILKKRPKYPSSKEIAHNYILLSLKIKILSKLMDNDLIETEAKELLEKMKLNEKD